MKGNELYLSKLDHLERWLEKNKPIGKNRFRKVWKDNNKYTPHQGKKECERRMKQGGHPGGGQILTQIRGPPKLYKNNNIIYLGE